MERMDDTYETSYLYQGSTAELIFRKAEIKDAGLLTEIYDSSFYSDYIRYGEWKLVNTSDGGKIYLP